MNLVAMKLVERIKQLPETGVVRWRSAGRLAAITALFCSSFAGMVSAEEDRWAELRTSLFAERTIDESGDVMAIEAPKRAHDAAVVPIRIVALDPERQIQRIHLIVDKNPIPLAGIFSFTDASANWESMETRIRINEYTTVRAIGELADGSLHMASAFVKASGGCSAPALSDMSAAMARAGEMRLLLDDISGSDESSTAASEAVIRISHPNNSGMQFDQVSRNYIPAFFVHTIGAEIDGEPMLHVETNFSLSENPAVRLTLRHALEAAEMKVFAVDSKGNRYEEILPASS